MVDRSPSFSIDPDGIADALKRNGVAGAGGAGFPSAVKWSDPDAVSYLLVNHQESEPNYYADKWLGREHADSFADLFAALLDAEVFDAIVVGSKDKYREEWTEPLETATDGEIYEPTDLPVPVEEEDGVVFAYTPPVYTYSEETVLLMVTCGVEIGDDLPTDHGWIVHNTESLYNCYRALSEDAPVTRKFVHVDGETPRHRCLNVPIGTPASFVLEAAGVEDGVVPDGCVLADGGPGWCYEITTPPEEFGVRKRTNAVLVLDEPFAREHTEDDGHIDVLTARDWADREHEREPTRLEPDTVRIPLITNAAYEGFVALSEPIVDVGDEVSVGDVIAEPGEGISNTQHASIDGTVSEITETHVVIDRA